MGTDADGGQIVADLLCRLQADPPGGDLDLVRSGFSRLGNVLAAGQHGCRNTAGIGKEFLGILHAKQLSPVHDRNLPAHVVSLFPAVGHHQHFPAVCLQHVAQLDLQRITQVCVQGRKRLVQHQQTRFADQNAGQGGALLLPAGELGRFVVLESVQLHQPDDLRKPLFLLIPVLFPVQAAEDVLPHGHVREERIVLKQVADLPFLGRQVDVLFGVEQHRAVQLNMPPVRPFDAGNAFEGKALAAARGTQQTGDAVFGFKLGVQGKGPQPSRDVHDQAHAFTAFF